MYSPLTYQVQKTIREERRAERFAPATRAEGRRGARLGLAIAIALTLSVVAATPALAASSTFGYSSNYQYFTVPSGVTTVGFDVIGGSGANGQGSFGGGGSGGSGAEVTGAMAVTPGEVVTIWVGGAGQPGGGDGYGNPSHDDFDGGSGGTGYGGGPTTGNGGGGGAASYIKANGNLVALAGGGGGGGGSVAGGGGGAGSDGGYIGAGLATNGWDASARGAGGGTNAQGGSPDATNADNGGDGATGGSAGYFGAGGGGGGGGYYTCGTAGFYKCYSAGSGGSGGPNSGGGGGAGGNSFANSATTNVSFKSSGFSAGAAGQITLTYAAPSATAVSSSSATSVAGQSVRFVADVNPSDGAGTVTFTSDGTAIPGCSNVSFQVGGATEWLTDCSTSSLPPGTHTITATYSGDGNYLASSGSTTETVQPMQQATTTSLTAGASSVLIGTTDELTATVDSSDGGGTVAFTQGGQPLSGCGAVSLVATSGAYQAVCSTAWSAPGTYSIVATYSGDSGYAPSSATTTVTVNPTPPVVSSVSPKAGPTAGGQIITITGSYLSGATKVSFGKTAAKVAVVSGSQLKATVPAHAAGTVNVTVTTDMGTSAVTSADRYTYDALPTVSSIAPATGPKGTVVIVNGTGLVAGSKVAFGTSPASKVVRVSSTQLKATAPAGSGIVDVTVTTPGGTSPASPSDQFTYTS